MTTVTVDTEIAAPIERVFEVFTDLEQHSTRAANIHNIEVLTVGPFKLGSRWIETREVLGQENSAEMEVTAFERNRSYTITHTVFTFKPADGHTSVRVEFSLESHGLPPGMLAPVRWAIASRVRDVIGQDLADLQEFIERPQA